MHYKDVRELYGDNIPQDETDIIEGREVKFFVWTDAKHWGFIVAPVYRQESQTKELLCWVERNFSVLKMTLG